MTITAKVIADSIADGCPRLTTMQLRYPRFIHAEFMTHRVFSRNASSSRAIPIERVIQDVMDDTAMPIHWGANQSGMQAGEELPSGEIGWLIARDDAVRNAQRLADQGYHKQIVNRILEPFQHINVLVTATEWDNFFALRDHADAQPEIQELARAMRDVMVGSEPERLMAGQWHTPYVDTVERIDNDILDAMRISAARCASVSYKTVDGKTMSVERALSIYDSLTGDPLHASPFEHITRPDPDNGKGCRNFTGWHQWRSDIEHMKEETT
jgi:thymidylate synthase ThyX